MAWSEDTNRALAQLRIYLAGVTDEHTRRTAQAWITSWDSLAPQLEDALNELARQAGDGRIRRTDVMRSRRLQTGIELIRANLDDLFHDSGRHVIDRLDEVIAYSGAMQDQLLATQLPPTEQDIVRAWSRVDPRQVTAIVERTTEQITKRTFPLADEAAATMRRELVRGVVTGSNPKDVARKMLTRTEGLFNGGYGRALNIARTEMLDAHRAASALSDQSNADLLTGWVWTASLSSRTCPACFGMHGTVHALDEAGPLGHQQCRCTRVPKTKTWAELGFEGMNEPPSLLPDSTAIFDGLPAADQVHILGRRRYDAWRAGDYPMDSWATKRSTPGWRDSYVMSAAPAA